MCCATLDFIIQTYRPGSGNSTTISSLEKKKSRYHIREISAFLLLRTANIKTYDRTLHHPLQPLEPDFLGTTFLPPSSASFLPSSASCSTAFFVSSAVSLVSSSAALTALSVEPLQPLDAAAFFVSALPVPVLPPQPLPVACPGKVTPPALIRPATPRLASSFFTSFFIVSSSLITTQLTLVHPIRESLSIGYLYQKASSLSMRCMQQ